MEGVDVAITKPVLVKIYTGTQYLESLDIFVFVSPEYSWIGLNKSFQAWFMLDLEAILQGSNKLVSNQLASMVLFYRLASRFFAY